MPVTLQAIDQFTRIEIDRSSAPQISADDREQIDRAWHDLCARNPKYFNAPILVFDRYDPASGVIIAHIDEYKHHAVRHSVDLGISLLAVTAVLCRPDRERNAPTYLIGKRSTQSHMYGGLWELGPSGGIEPPSDDNAITFRGLIGQVDREVREEIGLSVIHQPAAAVSLVHDAYAGSTDIHIGIVLADAHEPDPNWEYDDTRWITLEDLIAWCDTKPDEIIPTTIAHARFLHTARA
jgi:8-oxo-dGTP pyrophosphatase MutT (NUDIX family)